jgi:putative transposase
VQQAVGVDVGKQIKGRKRFMSVDTLGLVLRVFVSAASTPEREGGRVVLQRVLQQGKAVRRVHTIWVDAGFDGNPFMRWVITVCRWLVQVVLRPKQTQGW